MKKEIVGILVGILLLFGFSKPLYAQDNTQYLDWTVYTGETYSLFTSSITWTKGSIPCAQFSVSSSVANWFYITDSEGKRITFLCVRTLQTADWILNVKVPENVEEDKYNAVIQIIGSSGGEFGIGKTEITGPTKYIITLTVVNLKQLEEEITLTGEALDNARSHGIYVNDLTTDFLALEKEVQNENFSYVRSQLLNIRNILAQRKTQKENENKLIRIVMILVIILIFIGVLVWSKKRKSKEEKSDEKNQIPSPILQEEIILKPNIQSIVAEKEQVLRSDESERERIRDSTYRRLARQYADGEITREEYEKLKKTLEDVI